MMAMNGRLPRAGLAQGYVVIVVGLLLVAIPLGLVVVFILLIKNSEKLVFEAKECGRLGFACRLAEDQHGYLPPIVGEYAGKKGTIIYHLLPFVGDESLYQSGDIKADLNWYRSPNDSSGPSNGIHQGFGTTNFAANWLAFHGGPTPSGKTTLKESFPDGTSNTVLFTTRYQICNGTPMYWSHAHLDNSAPMFGYASTALFQMVPSQEECDPTRAQALRQKSLVIGLADCSVRHVSPGLSAETWKAVLTPAGNDIIGQDWDN